VTSIYARARLKDLLEETKSSTQGTKSDNQELFEHHPKHPESTQEKTQRRVQRKTQSPDSVKPEDRFNGGRLRGPSDVAEVIAAYRGAFALTESGLSISVAQPASNALARRAIDRYGLQRVLAAVSLAPRHRWISSEFLAQRRVPSLQTLLSDKVLTQLIAAVSEE